MAQRFPVIGTGCLPEWLYSGNGSNFKKRQQHNSFMLINSNQCGCLGYTWGRATQDYLLDPYSWTAMVKRHWTSQGSGFYRGWSPADHVVKYHCRAYVILQRFDDAVYATILEMAICKPANVIAGLACSYLPRHEALATHYGYTIRSLRRKRLYRDI